MRLRYLTGALHDLRLIFEYIAQSNPEAARRVIDALRKEVRVLVEHPEIGRMGQVEGTRELVHDRYPYIIAYRVQKDEAQILGVVHASRKWPEDF